MDLKLFTQNVYMSSPTYYELLKESGATENKDFPFVNMTADVSFSKQELSIDDNAPVLDVDIRNKMWRDPQENEEGYTHFGLDFQLTRDEVIHLNKYLEAFLESTKDNLGKL